MSDDSFPFLKKKGKRKKKKKTPITSNHHIIIIVPRVPSRILKNEACDKVTKSFPSLLLSLCLKPLSAIRTFEFPFALRKAEIAGADRVGRKRGDEKEFDL